MNPATEPAAPVTTTATLSLVVIRAADLESSARFYGAMGLALTRHRHGDGPEHFATTGGSAGGSSAAPVFEIYPRRGAHDVTTFTRLGFRVTSLEQTLARLEVLGTPVLSPAKDTPWGRTAVVGDPDGHRVEIVQA